MLGTGVKVRVIDLPSFHTCLLTMLEELLLNYMSRLLSLIGYAPLEPLF